MSGADSSKSADKLVAGGTKVAKAQKFVAVQGITYQPPGAKESVRVEAGEPVTESMSKADESAYIERGAIKPAGGVE